MPTAEVSTQVGSRVKKVAIAVADAVVDEAMVMLNAEQENRRKAEVQAATEHAARLMGELLLQSEAAAADAAVERAAIAERRVAMLEDELQRERAVVQHLLATSNVYVMCRPRGPRGV